VSELPKTRAEARAAGLTKYDTGLPCRRGHLSPRYASNGTCVQCSNDISRRWQEKNAESLQGYRAEWREKNRERINQYQREWRKAQARARAALGEE
jgi:hypothetical protein